MNPSNRFLWRRTRACVLVSSLMVSIRTPTAIATNAARTRQARTYPITPCVFFMPPSGFIAIANLTFRLNISN